MLNNLRFLSKTISRQQPIDRINITSIRMASTTTRIQVGKIDLLSDGKMKEIPFPSEDSETKILLSRVSGKYYATSNKCTHYGAPLVGGVLNGETGRLVCQWHGACFKVENGDIEDAPGLNALQSFKVETDSTHIYVIPPTDLSLLSKHREPKSLSASSISSEAGVIIIGGGAGGAHAAEALREGGYSGPVRVISSESYLPVDRTKLSKALITDPKKIALRDEAFYKKLGVEFMLDSEVKSFDSESNSLELNGHKYTYDHLIVATGSTPNKIPFKGIELENIFVLRTVDHAAEIDAAIGPESEIKKNVTVVGSSFIGMEVALVAAKRAKVTVVGMDEVPFKAILGETIGAGIQKYHESQGTKFYLPADISHFAPSSTSPASIGSVQLKDGTIIPTDVLVLGVGVKPQTSILKASGLALENDGGIIVDGSLRVKQISKGNVYAIGDIAHFPDAATGEVTRVEHWNVASNHARTVASTICGQRSVYNKQALFWSVQGQNLRYVGSAKSKKWEDVIIQGEPNDLKFIAYYTLGEEVVAIASMQNDPIVSHCSELLALGKMPSASEIRAGKNPREITLGA